MTAYPCPKCGEDYYALSPRCTCAKDKAMDEKKKQRARSGREEIRMTTKHEGTEPSRGAAEYFIAPERLEEIWDGLMDSLKDLRERSVPLDTVVWRIQVIEEVVPGQSFRSKRPGAKLTCTLTFFSPVDPQDRKACGIKDPTTTETDNG